MFDRKNIRKPEDIYRGMSFKNGNVVYHVNKVNRRDFRCELTKIYTNKSGDLVETYTYECKLDDVFFKLKNFNNK